jgi:hypothetical protein
VRQQPLRRHVHVEGDDVRGEGLGQRQGLDAVAGNADVEVAFSLEDAAQILSHQSGIVGDQQLDHLIFTGRAACSGSGRGNGPDLMRLQQVIDINQQDHALLPLQVGDAGDQASLFLGQRRGRANGAARNLQYFRHGVDDEASAHAVDREHHDPLPIIAFDVG